MYIKPRVAAPNSFQRSTPEWAGTPQHQPKVLLPGGGHINAAEFNSADAVVITVNTGGAAQNATTIPVVELKSPQDLVVPGTGVLLPKGALLDFTGAGKFAKLTAPANVGATSLTVEALPQALVAGDVARYSHGAYKLVANGQLVGRTWAERDAGTGYGPADVATDEEIYLLYFDIHNALVDNEAELYMHGNVVYENLLPGWATLPAPVRAYIRSNYHCIAGVI